MIAPTSYAAAVEQRRLALCVRFLEDVQLCVLVVFQPEVKELDVALEGIEGNRVVVAGWYEEVPSRDDARSSWKRWAGKAPAQTRVFANRCQMRLPVFFPSADLHQSMGFRLDEPEPAICDDLVPTLCGQMQVYYAYSPLLPRVPILLKADASEFGFDPRSHFSPGHLYELWISYEFERFEAQWMLPLTRAENPPNDGGGRRWARIQPVKRIKEYFNQLGPWLPKTGIVVQLSADGESALLMSNSIADTKGGNQVALSSARNIHDDDDPMSVGDYVKYLPAEVNSNYHRTLHLALYTKPTRTSRPGLVVSECGEFRLSFPLAEQHRLTNEPVSICVWEKGGLHLTLSDPKGKLARPELGELVGQRLSVAVRPSVSMASGVIRWAIADVLTLAPSVVNGRASIISGPSFSSLRPPPSPDATSTIGGASSSLILAALAKVRLPPSPEPAKCADTLECDAVVQGAYGANTVVLLLVQAGSHGMLEVARRYTPNVQLFNYPAEPGHWYRIHYQRYLLLPTAGMEGHADPRVDEIHVVSAVRLARLNATYHASVINGRVCFRRPFRASISISSLPEETLDYEVLISEWKQVESLDSMEDETQLMDMAFRSVGPFEHQREAWCYPTAVMSKWNVAEVCWTPVVDEEEALHLIKASSTARGFATPEKSASRRSGSPTSTRASSSPAKTCGEIEEAPALFYEAKGNELLFLLFTKGSDLQIMRGEYKPECAMTKNTAEVASASMEIGQWYRLTLERYCNACTRFKLHHSEPLPEPFLRVETIAGKVSIYTTILCRGNERNNYGCEMGRVLISSWEMEHEASKIRAGLNGAWVTPVCDFKKNQTKFQLTRVDGLIEDCTDQERKIVARKKKPRKSPPRPHPPTSPTQRLNKNKDKLYGKAVVQCFGERGVTLLVLYGGANQDGPKIAKRYTDDKDKFSPPLVVGQWYQIIYQRLPRFDAELPATATAGAAENGVEGVEPAQQPPLPPLGYNVKIFGALKLGPEADMPYESKVIGERVCFLLFLKIVYQTGSTKQVQYEVFVDEWKYVARFDNVHEGTRLRSLLDSSREPCLRVQCWAYPMDSMRDYGVAAVVWDKRRQENSVNTAIGDASASHNARGPPARGSFNQATAKSKPVKDLGAMAAYTRSLRDSQLGSETYLGPASLLARDDDAELVELWLQHEERWQLAYSRDIRRFNGEDYNRLGAWFNLQYRCVPIGPSALFLSILNAELKPESDHPYRAELMNASVNFLLNGMASFHPPQPAKTECFMDEWLPVTAITRQHDQSQLQYRLKEAGGDVTLEFTAWCQPPTHPQGKGLRLNMITEWKSDENGDSGENAKEEEQKMQSPLRPSVNGVTPEKSASLGAQVPAMNLNKGSPSSTSSSTSQTGRSESIASSVVRLNLLHGSTSSVNAEPATADARGVLNRTHRYHKAVVKRVAGGQVELLLLRMGHRRSVLGTYTSTDMGLFTRCKPNDWYWLTYQRYADPTIDAKYIRVLKATNLSNLPPLKKSGKIDFVTRLNNGEVNFLVQFKATALHVFPNARRAGVVKFECLFGSEWESVAAFDDETDRRTIEEVLAEEGANWAQMLAWIRHSGFEAGNNSAPIYVVAGADWNQVKMPNREGSFMAKRLVMPPSGGAGLSPSLMNISPSRVNTPPSPNRANSKPIAPISSPARENPPQRRTPVRRLSLGDSNPHIAESQYQHIGVVCHAFPEGDACLLYCSDFPTELRIDGENAKTVRLGQWLRFNTVETAAEPVFGDFEAVGEPPYETTPCIFGGIFVKCQITVELPNVEDSTDADARCDESQLSAISAFGAPVYDEYEHLMTRHKSDGASGYFASLGYQHDPEGAAPAEGYWLVEHIF